MEPDAGVAVLVVVVVEEDLAERTGVLDAVEAGGEGGAVLEGLERGVAVGVVVADMGRLWLRSTPRSTSNWETGLEVIEVPRSACNVRLPGVMPCSR